MSNPYSKRLRLYVPPNGSKESDISGDNGDILYIDDNQLKNLSIGEQDEVLKVGATGLPEWGPNNAVTGLYSSSKSIFRAIIESEPSYSVISTPVNPAINGSLTVPAQAFAVGNSFKIEMGGVCNFIDNAENVVKIVAKSGNPPAEVRVDLATISYVSVSTGGFKPWKLEANFTIQTIGGAGTSFITTFAQFGYQPNAGGFITFTDSKDIQTVDTLVDQILEVTISSNVVPDNAEKQIETKFMTLSKLF